MALTEIPEHVEAYLRPRCSEVGDCWRWRMGTTGEGNPAASIAGKRAVSVRHWVAKQMSPNMPQGHRAITTCADKLCLYPHHVKPVSASQMMQWLAKRGRCSTPAVRASRAKSARAKAARMTGMSMEKARAMRADRASGLILTEIADRHGISLTTVSRVCRNESWRETVPAASIFTLAQA